MHMDETTAGKILSDRGLKAFIPLNLVAHRAGCDVWRSKLFTPYGDAEAEIQIYPLKQDPVTVVDMEEEAGALERSASRALAHEIRDEEYGILVTCARKDEAILKRYFSKGIPEERSLTYHPQLDRILGGDYFHQLKGHWLKACLSSQSRATEIHELLGAAASGYSKAPDWDGKLESPFPVILAMLSIPAVDLPGAPPEYREMALTQLVISSPEPVEVAPPENLTGTMAFCRQLFGTIGATHRAGLGFSRDAGCCLRPEFLIADGSLSDSYFLSSLERAEDPEDIRLRDLWNALLVTCEFSNGELGFTSELIKTALAQYTRQKKLAPEVVDLVRTAAKGLEGNDVTPLQMLVQTCFRIGND